MNKYVIITDSACDLTDEVAKKFDLQVCPLKFVIEGVEYPDYLDHRAMSPEDFYAKVRSGLMPSTAQVNTEEYIGIAEPFLKKGDDVLIIAFSSALSGTYNSARIAVEQLKEMYPTRKVMLVDSKAASLGQGLLVYHAATMRANNHSIEEVTEFLEAHKLHLAHWFTVSDIQHLKRGGRVSGAAALVAGMLNINPVLHVSDEGKLISRMKPIGRKKALKALFEKMKETYDPTISNVCFISHGDDLKDAIYLKEMIEKELDVDIRLINHIGPVIGAHSGPNTIALFFFAKHR